MRSCLGKRLHKLKNVFGLMRWILDGRRFHIKPNQDDLTEGLSTYDIPEIDLLFSGTLRDKKIVTIGDLQSLKAYELEPA